MTVSRFALGGFLVTAALAATGRASAQPVELARTGQTSCHDTAGQSIPCGGTGQDGDTQAGVAWPSPRFAANGDGTLTDKLTGLVWLQDANCIKSKYPAFDNDTFGSDPSGLGDGSVTWAHCLEFIAGLNQGTYPDCAAAHADWRMANVNELETLTLAESSGATWLESQGFSNVGGSGYWSSSTHRSFLPGNGWFVDLAGGAVSNTDKTDVGGCLPVRAGQTDGKTDATYPANVFKTGQSTSYQGGDDGDVAAGVSWPAPRFVDNGDGTVTDGLTGLTWLKDANCLATSYGTVDSDGRVSWQAALDFVAGLNDGTYPGCAAGHNDWRLPNRRELHSLTDHGTTSGDTLPAGHPFVNVDVGSSPGYWSSTTYAPLKTWAWFWNPKQGDISGTPKSGERSVWPVRSTLAPSPDPQLAVSPTSLDFGDVVQGETSPIEILTLSNSGASTVTVLSMTLSSAQVFLLTTDVIAQACGSTSPTLAAGESCTVGLRFKPDAVKAFTGTLTFASDDPAASEIVVQLTGSGVAFPDDAPRCEISPTSHDFGELPKGERSAPQLFTIANKGHAALNVTLFNDQQATDFAFDLNGGGSPCGSLPFTLGVNAECTFTVVFAPRDVGQREGWIHVHSDDPLHPSIQLTLTGSGTPDQSKGGCGCEVGRAAGGLRGAALLLALGLLVLLRRRRAQ